MPACEKCGDNGDLTEGLCEACKVAEDIPASQGRKATPCPCGNGPVQVKAQLQCTECTIWWHPACVGLDGLNQYMTSKINDWKCPTCFKLDPEIVAKLGLEDTYENSSADAGSIKAEVRKQIQEAIPVMTREIVGSVKESLGESQVALMQDANEKITKSWAEIVGKNQKKVINEVVEKTSETALKKSISLIDANLTEQRKRTKHCVISNIPEEYGGADASLTEAVVDVLNEEELNEDDIVSSKRLGQRKPGNTRIVLVVFKTEENASYFHNWGRGRKLRGNMWVNPDLTRTEREAQYQSRQDRRNRRHSDEDTVDQHDEERRPPQPRAQRRNGDRDLPRRDLNRTQEHTRRSQSNDQ